MTVELCNITDNENKIEKTINNKTEFQCLLKDKNDIQNLNILLDYQFEEFTFNYCYIPKFKRYYFIDNITIERNNLLNISLSEDVLMTYKTEILLSSGLIINTNDNTIGSGYNESGLYETLQYKLNDVFTTESDILITVQGA